MTSGSYPTLFQTIAICPAAHQNWWLLMADHCCLGKESPLFFRNVATPNTFWFPKLSTKQQPEHYYAGKKNVYKCTWKNFLKLCKIQVTIWATIQLGACYIHTHTSKMEDYTTISWIFFSMDKQRPARSLNKYLHITPKVWGSLMCLSASACQEKPWLRMVGVGFFHQFAGVFLLLRMSAY